MTSFHVTQKHFLSLDPELFMKRGRKSEEFSGKETENDQLYRYQLYSKN